MIKRQELVNDILDLYDYIDALELENERLKNAVPKIRTQEKVPTFIDVVMIEEGKKEILRKVLYSWNRMDCNYDDETEAYSVTPYIKWLDRKINHDKIPSSMSFNDFTTYFKSELLEMYKKEKEEALKEAKENE